MELILSHRTMAFATHIPYLRKRLIKCERYLPISKNHKPVFGDQELKELKNVLWIDERLCTMTANSKPLDEKQALFSRHPYKGLPELLLVPLMDGVYGLRPELCFLQMASELPMNDLIRFGYDLCGTYAPGHGGYKTSYKMKPLTTVADLQSFIARCKGVHGAVKAAKAAKYIKDGSASPMESNLSMHFSLPFSMGGYNAPSFEMNKLFNEAPNMRFPDLYWERYGIDMEYDSDEFHNERTRDAIRSNQLQAANIEVLTVTNEMLKSPSLMDDLARDFYKMAKLRFRPQSKNFEKAKWNLLCQLNEDEWYLRRPKGPYALWV